jgi:hypothetical protein
MPRLWAPFAALLVSVGLTGCATKSVYLLADGRRADKEKVAHFLMNRFVILITGVAAAARGAALSVLLLASPAVARDLPLARAYRQILDVCLQETLLNKDAHIRLIEAGSTMLTHCGCVADLAMVKIQGPDVKSLLDGEITATAGAAWQEAHRICIYAGH